MTQVQTILLLPFFWCCAVSICWNHHTPMVKDAKIARGDEILCSRKQLRHITAQAALFFADCSVLATNNLFAQAKRQGHAGTTQGIDDGDAFHWLQKELCFPSGAFCINTAQVSVMFLFLIRANLSR